MKVLISKVVYRITSDIFLITSMSVALKSCDAKEFFDNIEKVVLLKVIGPSYPYMSDLICCN